MPLVHVPFLNSQQMSKPATPFAPPLAAIGPLRKSGALPGGRTRKPPPAPPFPPPKPPPPPPKEPGPPAPPTGLLGGKPESLSLSGMNGVDPKAGAHFFLEDVLVASSCSRSFLA